MDREEKEREGERKKERGEEEKRERENVRQQEHDQCICKYKLVILFIKPSVGTRQTLYVLN